MSHQIQIPTPPVIKRKIPTDLPVILKSPQDNITNISNAIVKLESGNYNVNDFIGNNVWFEAYDTLNPPVFKMQFARIFGKYISFNYIDLDAVRDDVILKNVGENFQYTNGVVTGTGFHNNFSQQIGIKANGSNAFYEDLHFKNIGTVSIYFGTDDSNNGIVTNGYANRITAENCYGTIVQFNPHKEGVRLDGRFLISNITALNCGYAPNRDASIHNRPVVAIAPQRQYNKLKGKVEIFNVQAKNSWGCVYVQENGSAQVEINCCESINSISHPFGNWDNNNQEQGYVNWYGNKVTSQNNGLAEFVHSGGAEFTASNNSWQGDVIKDIIPNPMPSPIPDEPVITPDIPVIALPLDFEINVTGKEESIQIDVIPKDSIEPTVYQIKFENVLLNANEKIVAQRPGYTNKIFLDNIPSGDYEVYLTGVWENWNGKTEYATSNYVKVTVLPMSIPEPIPEPTPEPIPEPIPEPTPEPIPEPIPEPTPKGDVFVSLEKFRELETLMIDVKVSSDASVARAKLIAVQLMNNVNRINALINELSNKIDSNTLNHDETVRKLKLITNALKNLTVQLD